MANLVLRHEAKLSKIRQMWHLQTVCSKFAIEVNLFFRPVLFENEQTSIRQLLRLRIFWLCLVRYFPFNKHWSIGKRIRVWPRRGGMGATGGFRVDWCIKRGIWITMYLKTMDSGIWKKFCLHKLFNNIIPWARVGYEVVNSQRGA